MAIAGTTYAAVGRHHNTVTVQQRLYGSPRILATVDYQVTQLAVNGKYLYLLAGQNSMLTAYDSATGKLVRRINLPAEPSGLTVGPGGLVWVAFYPHHGAPALWLLSPDLRLHCATTGFKAVSIVPVTRTSARIPESYGLLQVAMPGPGQSGLAIAISEPYTSLGATVKTAPGSWSGDLGDRIAVFVTDPDGADGHLVLAGSPGLRFGGSLQTQISAMTSTGNALWVTTYALHHGETSLQGPLVRLDAELRPTTPGPVRASPVLTRSEDVWSAGHTIWVATGVRGHALVCFTAGSRIGRLTTLPVSGEVRSLAATSTTVYVNAEQPPGSYAPSRIVSHPVPASCR
jgi:hypothetical protein